MYGVCRVRLEHRQRIRERRGRFMERNAALPRLRGAGGSLGGGVGARPAERARKVLQKMERSR